MKFKNRSRRILFLQEYLNLLFEKDSERERERKIVLRGLEEKEREKTTWLRETEREQESFAKIFFKVFFASTKLTSICTKRRG